MKNGFLKVFKTEFRLLIQSPKKLFYVLVFPLVLFAFLAALFIDGVPRDLPTAYLDNDQSMMSSKLVRMLDATPAIAMAIPVTDEGEAKRLIQQGKVYGFIVIPNHFQKSIYQGLEKTVVCYTNNQFILPAGLIQKDFQRTIATFAAGVRINKATQNGVQQEQALAQQVPVRTDIHILFNPYTNYAYYLLIALFPMMLHMVAMMITVYTIGLPFKYKTGTIWLKLAGGNVWSALWGKLLPYTICLFFLSWWMNYFLFNLIGLPLKTNLFNMTLVTFFMVFIYQLLGVAIVSVTKDLRSAMTLGSGFTALALSFAAYTFPIEGLPTSIQYFAQIFPFKHFLEYYINRGIRGIPVGLSLEPILCLSAFVLLFVLSYPKFVKRIQKGGYE